MFSKVAMVALAFCSASAMASAIKVSDIKNGVSPVKVSTTFNASVFEFKDLNMATVADPVLQLDQKYMDQTTFPIGFGTAGAPDDKAMDTLCKWMGYAGLAAISSDTKTFSEDHYAKLHDDGSITFEQTWGNYYYNFSCKMKK